MSTKLTKYNLLIFLKSLGYTCQAEYKFAPDRKFRADFFVELGDKKILIEYEGIFATKSRHTSLIGYTKDCEKYNLAGKLGYVVLRYTAKNFDDVIVDLERIKTADKIGGAAKAIIKAVTCQ